MSAHVLSNLLSKFKKTDKMQGLLSILSLFRNKFDQFNNTGVYLSYDTKTTFSSHFFGMKMLRLWHIRNVAVAVILLYNL